MTVTLAQPATATQAQSLNDAGLTPGRGGLTWYGGADDEHADAGGWDHRLRELSLEIAEIRVRAPSLEGVYLRMTGEELRL